MIYMYKKEDAIVSRQKFKKNIKNDILLFKKSIKTVKKEYQGLMRFGKTGFFDIDLSEFDLKHKYLLALSIKEFALFLDPHLKFSYSRIEVQGLNYNEFEYNMNKILFDMSVNKVTSNIYSKLNMDRPKASRDFALRKYEHHIDKILSVVRDYFNKVISGDIDKVTCEYDAAVGRLENILNDNYDVTDLFDMLDIYIESGALSEADVINILACEVFKSCSILSDEIKSDDVKIEEVIIPEIKEEVNDLVIDDDLEDLNKEEDSIEETFTEFDNRELLEVETLDTISYSPLVKELLDKINLILDMSEEYFGKGIYGNDNTYYTQIALGIATGQNEFLEVYNEFDSVEKANILTIALNDIKANLENDLILDFALYDKVVDNIGKRMQEIQKEVCLEEDFDKIREDNVYALLDSEGRPIFDFDIDSHWVTDKHRQQISNIIEKLKTGQKSFRSILIDRKISKGYYFDYMGETGCAFKKIDDEQYIIINIDTSNSNDNFFNESRKIILSKKFNRMISVLEKSIINNDLSEEEMARQKAYVNRLEGPNKVLTKRR